MDVCYVMLGLTVVFACIGTGVHFWAADSGATRGCVVLCMGIAVAAALLAGPTYGVRLDPYDPPPVMRPSVEQQLEWLRIKVDDLRYDVRHGDRTTEIEQLQAAVGDIHNRLNELEGEKK